MQRKILCFVLCICVVSFAQTKLNLALCANCNPCNDSNYLLFAKKQNLTADEKLFYDIRSQQCKTYTEKRTVEAKQSISVPSSMNNASIVIDRQAVGYLLILGGVISGTLVSVDGYGASSYSNNYTSLGTVHEWNWTKSHTIGLSFSIIAIAAGISLICVK